MAIPPRPTKVHKQARGLLDQVLTEETAAATDGAADEVSVEEALQERPILSSGANRDKTRVLFVTNDTTFLNPVDEGLERFYATANEFDEMHIMVLRSGIIPTKPVLRVRENIWVYIASAEYWWWTPVIAHEVVAPNQLVFAGGFRPDLVVALEPFEAAVAARWIAKTYNRPLQVHVRTDFQASSFTQRSWRNWWRRRIARYILKRVRSVRTQTNQMCRWVKQMCHRDAVIEVLPRFNNFKAIKDAQPKFDVHDMYPTYEKILLFVGPLDRSSSLFGILDAMKYVLANPRVALVVLGDGPVKQDCQRKVQKIGLTTQVVFPDAITDVTSYLKTSDVLVVTDSSALADELTLQAAVAHTPTIMLESEMRDAYFTDGQDAYLCPEDEECFKQKFHAIVHDESVRERFTHELANTVTPRLARDAATYQEKYRTAIETVFVEQAAASPEPSAAPGAADEAAEPEETT